MMQATAVAAAATTAAGSQGQYHVMHAIYQKQKAASVTCQGTVASRYLAVSSELMLTAAYFGTPQFESYQGLNTSSDDTYLGLLSQPTKDR